MQSYFIRVSQIKEQLEAVEEVENGEIVMTTLNGLPRSWDSFIQGICARIKLITFSRLWEECSQENFAFISRYTSIISVISLAAVMKWKIHQMDVKIDFLNGVVEEEVYVEQPLGFETHDRESHVCRLKKALYGLKWAPKTWYGRIDSFLTSFGFTKSKEYSNL